MTPFPLDIIAYAGATFAPFEMQFFSEGTTPFPLTGWTAEAQARAQAGGAIIVDLVPGISNAAQGIVSLSEFADEATNLWPLGNYFWDVLLVNPSGKVYGPFVAGRFVVKPLISQP